MGERLQKLVLTAFRGVPGQLSVDFGAGQSIAIYGDNGTGKSTIADALEWFYTGQIELLTHEGRSHAIRNLQGGRKSPATSVEVVTDGALGGTLAFPAERTPEELAATANETFLLRGRTLADFINKTKGEKWKALVEILRLDAVENLREDLQRARNDLRKQVKAAEEQVAAIRAPLGGEGDDAVLESLQQVCGMLGVEPPDALDRVLDPEWLLGVTAAAPAPGAGRQALAAEAAGLQVPDLDKKALEAWNRQVGSEAARSLPQLSLMQEGQKALAAAPREGLCPLCGQKVSAKELGKRIEGALVSLLSTHREVESVRAALSEAVGALQLAHGQRDALLRKAKPLKAALPALPPFPAGLLTAADEQAAVDAKAVAAYLSALGGWDTAARTALGAGTAAAAGTRDQQLLMLSTLCRQIKDWRAAEKASREAARACALAEAVFDAYQDRQQQDVAALLARISERVARIYTALHPDEELGAVSIEPWTAKGVEMAIDFHGKRQRPPHGVLSESHLNSLAIALFLAMAETFNEKMGFLVLDDVINSFDREHRSQLADLLANEFSQWQLVVLTHDHQFFEHLTRRAPSWRKLELTSWTYGEGPRTLGYETSGTLAAARERLDQGDVGGAAAKARRALEEQLQEVCQALEAPLAFRRGQANEQREIGELLRGLRRALKEHAKALLDELEPLFKTLEADVQATLNVEVHASRGRSGGGEVKAALQRIEDLDRRWSCSACGSRIWHRGTPQAGRCRCGKSTFPPSPAG